MKKLKTKEEISSFCKGIDINIADHLDKLRKQKLIPMVKLAEHLGVSIQQVTKYLKGKNRISLGRLIVFSDCLGCDVNYFLRDYIKEIESFIQPFSPFKNTDKLNSKQIILINKIIENIIYKQ